MKNPKARDLLTCVYRKTGRFREAIELVQQTLKIDPLDYWALNEQFLLLGMRILTENVNFEYIPDRKYNGYQPKKR